MSEIEKLIYCCACGELRADCRTHVMLDVRAPVPGTGWGCVVCGLANDGAVAVICDRCFDEKRPIREACVGYAAESTLRVRIDELQGPFEHDRGKHEESEAGSQESGVSGRLIAIAVDGEESARILESISEVIARASARGDVRVESLPPLERVLAKLASAIATETGTCMVCGCTAERPCEGGCAWVNEELTLCSACVGGITTDQALAMMHWRGPGKDAAEKATALVNEWLETTNGMPVTFQLSRLGLMIATAIEGAVERSTSNVQRPTSNAEGEGE